MSKDIVKLTNIRLRVDTKQINDGGNGTVSNASAGAVVSFNKLFADVESVTVTAERDDVNGPHAERHFEDVAYPSTFTVHLRATKGPSAGSFVTGSFSWAARGIEGVIPVAVDPTPTDPDPDPPPVTPPATSNLTAVWANTGQNKVTKDELRSSNGQNVTNSIWNGTTINIFGAKNETVACNIVLEAKTVAVSNVEVIFTTLTGPGGATITTTAKSGNNLFNYVGRNIELFHVGYLEFKGLSKLHYAYTYDERHVPKRCRRPWTGNGAAVGGSLWVDRPDHNKLYPEILYPMEVKSPFNIVVSTNQSVWIDVTIPKTAVTGLYTGTIIIKEGGTQTRSIPIQLTVRNFALPDTPYAKTMLYLGTSDLLKRWRGYNWPTGPADDTILDTVRTNYFKMLKRHGLGFMDDNEGSYTGGPQTRAPTYWSKYFDGTAFSAANGYEGRGQDQGQLMYMFGTYGLTWVKWNEASQSDIETKSCALEQWFIDNYPTVDRMVYISDESTDYARTERLAGYIRNQTGVGKNLHTFATLSWQYAISSVPSLDRPSWWFNFGDTTTWNGYYTSLINAGREAGLYNSHRPNLGSLATEDDGTAPQCIFWAMFKKSVSRWLFWAVNYYNDYQSGFGDNDLFHTMRTFGLPTPYSTAYGDNGYLHSNGDGVLMYPGTDTVHAADSLGLDGPIAGIRLKLMRRGSQDFDYLTMAKAKNATATNTIVSTVVPSILWETGVTDVMDPTYHYEDQTWSDNPDGWEAARASLATIIES